jgi:hypothetical protein
MPALRLFLTVLLLGGMLAGCVIHDRPYMTFYYSAGPPPGYGADYDRLYGCWHCW